MDLKKLLLLSFCMFSFNSFGMLEFFDHKKSPTKPSKQNTYNILSLPDEVIYTIFDHFINDSENLGIIAQRIQIFELVCKKFRHFLNEASGRNIVARKSLYNLFQKFYDYINRSKGCYIFETKPKLDNSYECKDFSLKTLYKKYILDLQNYANTIHQNIFGIPRGTVLMFAANTQNFELTNALLEIPGINVDIKNVYSDTAQSIARLHKNKQICDLIMQHKNNKPIKTKQNNICTIS